MKELLQRGNIFKIENGMKIYVKIPEKFIFDNRRNSSELHKYDVKVGDVYSLSTSTKTDNLHDLKNEILQILKGNGITTNNLTTEKIDELFKSLNINLENEEFDTSIFRGKYVVTHTEYSGGGKAMFNDTYSDGWKVTAKRLINGTYNKDSLEISFYQSGSFTAMIYPSQLTLVGDMFA